MPLRLTWALDTPPAPIALSFLRGGAQPGLAAPEAHWYTDRSEMDLDRRVAQSKVRPMNEKALTETPFPVCEKCEGPSLLLPISDA